MLLFLRIIYFSRKQVKADTAGIHCTALFLIAVEVKNSTFTDIYYGEKASNVE